MNENEIDKTQNNKIETEKIRNISDKNLLPNPPKFFGKIKTEINKVSNNDKNTKNVGRRVEMKEENSSDNEVENEVEKGLDREDEVEKQGGVHFTSPEFVTDIVVSGCPTTKGKIYLFLFFSIVIASFFSLSFFLFFFYFLFHFQ